MENNHSEIVKNLRQERRNAVLKISQATYDLDTMLNALAMDDGDTLIKWEDLKKTELGMQLFVSEKVYFIKYLDRGDILGFKCFLKAGGSFGIQKHDCLEETTVLSGNLIETFREQKTYTKGETITYVDCQIHKPYCTVDSIYRVIFSKKHNHKTVCKE